MEPSSIFIRAMEAVDKAGLPEEFRLKAFEKAVDLLAGTIVPRTAQPMSPSPDRQASVESSPSSALDRIAAKLKVDVDVLRDIYHEQNGELDILVPSTKLEHGKKGGTRQLALLVAAGRQAADIEDFTSFDKVREVADQYRKYDSPNFSRTLNEMEDEFSFRGDSRNRVVRVSRPGWEIASKLVSALGGAEA